MKTSGKFPNEQGQALMFEQELGTVAKGAGIAFTGKVSGTGLKYITQIILARFLGTTSFGIYALGMVIYEVAEIFSTMGLHLGAVRYVSIYHSTGDSQRLKGVLYQVICLPFFSGAIIGTAIFLTSETLAQGLFGKPELAFVLRIFAISLPFWASTVVSARATTGFQTTKYLVFIREYLQPFSNLVLVVSLCLIGLKLLGATLAWVLSFLLAFASVLLLIRSIFPPITKKYIKPIYESSQLLKFSLPLALGEFMMFFLLRIDTLMIGYFRPLSEVGVYRAASQTALLLLLFFISFNNIFAPMVADIFHKGDWDKLKQLFKTITRWSITLTLPLFLIVLIGSRNILYIFGPDFTMGWLALIILGAGQLINAGSATVAYILIMSGHQYHKLFGDILIVIINLILNIILIPRWGLPGAAVATAVSIAGVNFMRIMQVYFLLRIHAYSWSFLKIIGFGALSALSGLVARNLLQSEHFLISLSATAGIMLSIYALLIWRTCIEDSDRMIIRKIKEKLKTS